MNARNGEKLGWIGGWLGGFLWVAILAVVFLFQGRTVAAITGICLAGIAAGVIFRVAPWRFPDAPYWKLLLPLYVLLAISAAWAFLAFGTPREAGLSWWSLFMILPLLTPFGSLGRRRWIDGDMPEKR